jgi:hypothetical protein
MLNGKMVTSVRNNTLLDNNKKHTHLLLLVCVFQNFAQTWEISNAIILKQDIKIEMNQCNGE